MYPATEVDLAAAVIGVDAWMLATGSRSLEDRSAHGAFAAAAMARCLARAAGRAPYGPLRSPHPALRTSPPARWFTRSDRWRRWVNEHDLDPSEVFTAAEQDLSVGVGAVGTVARLLELVCAPPDPLSDECR